MCPECALAAAVLAPFQAVSRSRTSPHMGEVVCLAAAGNTPSKEELMRLARRDTRNGLAVFLIMVALTACAPAVAVSKVPSPEPTWYGTTEKVAADEICPEGDGPRGLDCRKADPRSGAAPIFDACMERHQVKNAKILCQHALITWLECRDGARSNST